MQATLLVATDGNSSFEQYHVSFHLREERLAGKGLTLVLKP